MSKNLLNPVPRQFWLNDHPIHQPIAMFLVGAAILVTIPTAAHADPCTGTLPGRGTSFSGIVRYVGDGDSLCVGPADLPDRWIEIRLVDFRAIELHDRGGAAAKRLLERVAAGRMLLCRAGRRSYDRVLAACRLDGVPLGDILRARGGREGGR